LRHKNGLYFDEYSGSYESELHDVESILTIREMFDFYPPQMLIVGRCSGGQTQILIHTDEADPSRGMYAIDPIADDHFYDLNCNFTTFLDRFINSYGFEFWRWGYDGDRKISKIME